MKLTTEQMKQKIVWLYDELNRLNFDGLEEMFAPEFVSHGGAGFKDLNGWDEFRELYQTFLSAMPDLRFDLTFLVAENDIVFARGTLGGTHAGNFMGMAPPTDKYIRWTGTAIFKFDDRGLCTDRWQEWDGLGVMQQMGVIPTPDGQPAQPAPEPDRRYVDAGDSSPAQIQANRRLMERFIEEVWNRKNLAVSEEIFAPHATSPDAPQLPPGPAGVNVIAQTFFTAFPDFHMTIDFLAAEGDRVAAHFVQGGTHHGDLFGIAPTGRTVSFGEIGLLRLENGMVVESFYNTDMLGLMQQLGVGDEQSVGA